MRAGTGECGGAEVGVEGRAVVGSVGVAAGIGIGAEVVWQAGQTAGVGGELFEGYGRDVGVSKAEIGAKQIAQGGGEGDFFFDDRLGKE